MITESVIESSLKMHALRNCSIQPAKVGSCNGFSDINELATSETKEFFREIFCNVYT